MNVLMLGWEFPPLVNGGLGVATYGIVKALRSLVDIKLIIPSFDPAAIVDKVNIIGINNLDRKYLMKNSSLHLDQLLHDVQRIPLSISPYHYINQLVDTKSTFETTEALRTKETMERIRTLFPPHDMYGVDVMRKTSLFAALANELANPVDYDIIHAHDWVTFSAGIKIKERTGKPLVLHVHALETDRAGASTRNAIYQLEKDALDQADRILAVSHFTKEQLLQHYHQDPQKISVVHNGIDPVSFERKSHILKDKYVVFLGRITHQKGPEFLLETAEKVTRVYPRVKFVVAGTGDQFAHLLETTAYKKMGNKFIFTGFLTKEKVDELLAMADVYFMPSVSEPFGLTALEAAQHGVPGVLSKASGASEVLSGSLQADFWDTSKYANYIYALLKYDVLHKEVSRQASRELEGLTWEHTAKKILDVYSAINAKAIKN